MARNKLIFLLQNLGFLIKFEKSVLQPCHRLEFLGIVVDSRGMTLTLPQEKVNAIIDQCQLFLSKDPVTVWEIAQLIEKLSYSAVAVQPSPQRQHVLGFSMQKNIEKSFSISGGQERLDLVGKPKTEQWEITSEFSTSSNYSITSMNERLGAYCQGQRTGGHGQS